MQSDLQALSNDKAEPALAAGDLSELRANLDSIDDAIHDLLMRRAEVVSHIASVKTGAALRPGREAAIIRRLLARPSATSPIAWDALRQRRIGVRAPNCARATAAKRPSVAGS